MLDRSAPIPLWAQVLADLDRKLARGDFAARFPTDQELVSEYGVSRNTVREAVRRLGADGVIERRRGLGGRVRPSAPGGTGIVDAFSAALGSSGKGMESVVRILCLRTDPGRSSTLERPEDAELVHLERLCLLDGAPLALDRVWMPATLSRALLGADLAEIPPLAHAFGFCGVTADEVTEHVRPVAPVGEDRRLLELGPNQAVFEVESVARSRSSPIEHRRILLRADIFSPVTRWSLTHGTTSRVEEARSSSRTAR